MIFFGKAVSTLPDHALANFKTHFLRRTGSTSAENALGQRLDRISLATSARHLIRPLTTHSSPIVAASCMDKVVTRAAVLNIGEA
jgi:hypothetical protein